MTNKEYLSKTICTVLLEQIKFIRDEKIDCLVSIENQNEIYEASKYVVDYLERNGYIKEYIL